MKKQCEVVLLDSEKPTRLIYNKLSNGLLYENSLSSAIIAVDQMGYTYKNMYIVSDIKPSIGDFVIADFFGTIYRVSDFVGDTPLDQNGGGLIMSLDVIIATTDRSLVPCVCQNGYPCDDRDCLPRPSNEFIQAYVNSFNKGLSIEEVLVEYDLEPELIEGRSWSDKLTQYPNGERPFYMKDKPKIAPDNTISIFPVNPSEKMCTLIEVKNLITKAIKDVLQGVIGLEHHADSISNQWIKENLN